MGRKLSRIADSNMVQGLHWAGLDVLRDSSLLFAIFQTYSLSLYASLFPAKHPHHLLLSSTSLPTSSLPPSLPPVDCHSAEITPVLLTHLRTRVKHTQGETWWGSFAESH